MQVQFRLVPVIVTDEDVNPGSQVLRTHTHTSAENLGETGRLKPVGKTGSPLSS